MSSVEIDQVKHEIVIVRRGNGDHDEGHHGGVWKIAFADFMTAMMCFFLVMWLINASNEQTKAAVASYFNPVKLIDRNSSRKGLEDVGDGEHASGNTTKDPAASSDKTGSEGPTKAGPSNNNVPAEKALHSDDSLFADPYAVLAEIAAETGNKQNVSAKGEGGAQSAGPATGASGGESYRDPFAPDFWSQQVAVPLAAEASAERAAIEGLDDKGEKPVKEQAALPPVAETKLPPVAETELAPAEKPVEKIVEKLVEPDHKPTAETVRSATEIRQELAKAFPPGDKFQDGVEVNATEKGVTISVTDQLEFGMFEIGSAVPRRELVLAMEKIGKALAARKGQLTISGHTDARPFKGQGYDNWRLSTSRAHSAYYMLVRGGLDERRVTEVAGFADRKLKTPSQPMAAANRRIEILLESGGG